MATYYAKSNMSVQISDYSDYASANDLAMSSTWTPNRYDFNSTYTLSTTEITENLTRYTTVDTIIVENLDTAETVEAMAYSMNPKQDTYSFGTWVADVNGAMTFDAVSGATSDPRAGDYAYVSAATNPSQTEGAYLLQAATNLLWTFANDSGLNASGGSAGNSNATLQIMTRNRVNVLPGKFAIFHNVYPTFNLELRAQANTPDCRVTIFGT